MLDLGTSFLASVARDPEALAIVDGHVRLSYRAWYKTISALVAAFDEIGLASGDHLVTVLQNRWEAATIHWACQFAGIIITPLNWRSTAEELDFCVDDSEAKAIVYEEVSAAAVRSSRQAHTRTCIAVGEARAQGLSFDQLIRESADDVRPRVDAEAWSVMLYTSGTTAWPKGVPRRHRAERAAALAHVAQNLYAAHERTLGVMPLYHTMGVRSLLAMSLVGGAFVCLPRFEAARALELIAAERITNLYLVPTLYHDLLHHPQFERTDVSTVRKLGFAGAPMTDALLRRLADAFSLSYSSITTAPRKSIPSPSTRMRQQSLARPAARASTNWCAWCGSAPARRRKSLRPTWKARSSPCFRATNPSRAIGAARTPMQRPCGRAGTSPAIPDMSIPMAISSSPGASTT